MKIVIDARHFGPGATGIGRYTAHLLGELQELDKRNEYTVFLQKSNIDLFKPRSPNFCKKPVDAPIYSVKEQLLVPKALAEEKPDVTHFPHINVPVFYFGKFVVTIHDLIISEFGGTRATTLPLPLYWVKRLGYNLALRKAILFSQKILVPSEFIKGKILTQFKVSGEKIVVTYEAGELVTEGAVRTAAERKAENVVLLFGLAKPFLLYVGNVYPHKNVSRLLDAVGSAKVNLIIVSPRGFFLERLGKEVIQKGLGRYVRLLGFVSDPDLIDLYREAEALVFPSLSEGFGLPAVEAMSLGCPVLCSNVSSLPEVVGDAALLFDPYSSSDIAAKITQILKDKKLKAGLVKKGLAQAKKYSWRRMAEQTLRVYHEVIRE